MKFRDSHLMRTAGCLLLVVLGIAPAAAQEGSNTPAQIFASDCSLCHKTPQPLAKAGGPFGLGLENFLRNHYTASSQTAAVMAKYIQSFDGAPAAADKGTKRNATGTKASAKKSDSKKGDAKPAVALPGDNKPVEATPAEAKPAEPKSE